MADHGGTNSEIDLVESHLTLKISFKIKTNAKTLTIKRAKHQRQKMYRSSRDYFFHLICRKKIREA